MDDFEVEKGDNTRAALLSKLRNASKSRVSKRKRSDSNVVSISRDRSKSVAGKIMERDRSVMGLGRDDAKETVNSIFNFRKRQRQKRLRKCTKRFPILWQREVKLIVMYLPKCPSIYLVESVPMVPQVTDNLYFFSNPLLFRE